MAYYFIKRCQMGDSKYYKKEIPVDTFDMLCDNPNIHVTRIIGGDLNAEILSSCSNCVSAVFANKPFGVLNA